MSSVLLVSLVTARARPSDSQAPASDAQPGLHRVGIAEVARPALAATLGYGYTEKQSPTDGGHHRLSFRAAAALPVASWLCIGPVLDSRYDVHLHDSGAVLSGALLARAAVRQGAWRLGTELKGWVPGAEKASTMVDASSLEIRALVGAVMNDVELAGVVGYRLDRSAAVGGNAATLRPGDRFALGLSDFDAVLLGLGAGVPFGQNELLVEASADVLIGSGAPAFRQSPLRFAAGLRRTLTTALALELLGVGSPSAKPDLSTGARLVPNEPRFSAFAGVRYRFMLPNAVHERQAAPPLRTQPKTVPAPVAAAPTDASVALTVRDAQGANVPMASAKIVLGEDRRELGGDGAGHYRGEHVPVGNGFVRVEASGFEPFQQPVAMHPGASIELEVVLTALPPPSQLRGLIRNLNGKGLVAKVRVEPIGLETVADAEGAFRIDLAPGDYEVVIEAPGYGKQRRRVSVDPQGVVILNAELVKQR